MDALGTSPWTGGGRTVAGAGVERNAGTIAVTGATAGQPHQNTRELTIGKRGVYLPHPCLGETTAICLMSERRNGDSIDQGTRFRALA